MLRPESAGRQSWSDAAGQRGERAHRRHRSSPHSNAAHSAGLDVAVLVFSVAVALHAVGFMSLLSGWLNPLFNDAVNRLGQGADFFAVYGAGHNVLEGRSVYAVPGEAVPYAYPFRYLPSAGFSLGVLLNVTFPWHAYWAWVFFNEALLAVNLYLTWRAVADRRLALVAMSLWLVFTPFYLELFLGQFSFFMASCFFWMGLALQRGEPRRVGLAWVASLLVKSNSLLLAPLWLRLRMGWTMAGGLAVAALLNVPYFLLVEGSWRTWSGNFTSLGSGAVDPHPGNLGLPALLELVQRDAPGQVAASVAGLPWGVVVVAVCGVATMLAGPGQKLRLLALWICSYFLIFGEVWEHHYVMLLPALVLLILFDERLRPLALSSGLLLALPTPFALFSQGSPPLDFSVVDPQIFWNRPEVYIQHLAKVGPTLLLFGGLVTAVLQGDVEDVRENLRERALELRTIFESR